MHGGFRPREMPAGVPAGSGLAVLRIAQFRWLYGSNMLFFFAMNGQMIVRSYISFKLTDSPFSLGLINLAVGLPMLVASPFGGVVADRMEKRRLVMAGQAVLIANELAVLALLLAGMLEFWHLFMVAFVMGCTFPFIMPARQAMTVNIVGRPHIAGAMALGMGGMNAARIVAPALAGFLIYLVGVKATYGVAVVFYFLAFAALTRVNAIPPEPRLVARSVYGDIAEGMRYVWKEPPVRVLLLLGLVPMFLAMPFQSLLVVFTEDVWDVGSRGLGILQAGAGLGGLAGSFYLAWKGEIRRKLRMMMWSLVLFAAGLSAFALSPWFAVALVLVVLADVFVAVFQTLNNTVIQLLVPDAVRGRVMSMMMMTFGLTPIGTVPVSAVAQAFGAPIAVTGAAVITVVMAMAFYLLSGALRGIDDLSREALAREGPPMGAHGFGMARMMPEPPRAPVEPGVVGGPRA